VKGERGGEGRAIATDVLRC